MNKTRCLALLLSCCLPWSAPVPAAADAAPASTAATAETDPARQALDAWLAAFNTNDRKPLEAFRDRYQPDMDVDGMLDFHQRTGGFRLIRYEPSDRGSARALLRELDSDTIARIQVTAAANAPLALDIDIIEPPADLRIPRLNQTAAIDALTARADAAAKQDGFSGVLLVARGDDVLLQRAWGLADRKGDIAVTPDTKLRLGSMNKMFTAVATLQLVQAGKLSLQGSVGQYLPDYPNPDIAKVTIHQLLTHSGGTGDIFGPQFDGKRLSLKTHDDYVRLYGARGPEHPPGEAHRYSNYGFLLLGAIVERVSGRSYYDYVDEHVFAPAGMTDSGSLPEDVAVPGRARAYTREDRNAPWTDAADTLPYRGTAAGGGYSTAGDLLKFARALRNGTLLPPTLLAEATRQQIPWYGYGFVVAEQEGMTFYGHGGGAPGMNGELRIFPALDVVVIGLGNVDPPAVSRLVDYYQVRMPLTADAAPGTAAPETRPARSHVDGIADAIEQYYYDAQRGSRIAADLRSAAARGEFDDSSDARDLATRLTDRLDPLDRHFRVHWAAPREDDGPVETTPGLSPEDTDRRANHGIRRIEVLPGNIGHLDLRQFAHFDPDDPQAPARRSIDAALDLLAHVDALIIDLRDNGGGSPVMVGYLASAFAPADADIYNTFHLRERTLSEAPPVPHPSPRLALPLYLLTSPRTGSAAEAFAYTLGNAARATLVGTSTAGAANPGMEVDAGHGFHVFVSTGTPISPITGGNWEGTGVQPHVATEVSQAFDTARTLALEAVLASGLPAAEAVDTRWALEALRAETSAPRKVDADGYPGEYGTVGIDRIDGRLRLRRGERPPLALTALDDDLFTVRDDPSRRVHFQRNEQGQVIALELLRSDGGVTRHARGEQAIGR